MAATLSPSVLALNSDQSVYHLHLHPEDIADTVILVGDPQRVSAVSQHFSSITVKKQYREFVTHTGMYQQQPLSVISTGIGAGNIDIVLNEIDALKNINLKNREVKENPTQLKFIRLGTTGALQPEIAPGHRILSAYAAGFDGLAHFYHHHNHSHPLNAVIKQHLNNEMLQHNLYTGTASAELINQFSALGQQGITLTAHGFYGAQNRSLRIPLGSIRLLDSLQHLTFNNLNVTNFEMETAMIYALSEMLGHQALSISCVVYNRATEAASSNPRRDVDTMIEAALQCL